MDTMRHNSELSLWLLDVLLSWQFYWPIRWKDGEQKWALHWILLHLGIRSADKGCEEFITRLRTIEGLVWLMKSKGENYTAHEGFVEGSTPLLSEYLCFYKM